MTNSEDIGEIKSLVVNDIDLYDLFELNQSFTPQELEAHYKMCLASCNDNLPVEKLIADTGYEILKDDEKRHIYNHYRSKHKKHQLKQNTKAAAYGTVYGLWCLGDKLWSLAVWFIKNLWWLPILILLALGHAG